MAKKEAPHIDEIINNRWLVEFRRKGLSKDKFFVFLLACNDEFSLVNVFVDEHYYLNGYTVIRNKDVTHFRVYNEDDYFLSIVIRQKKIKPKPLKNISIENWKDVLLTANDQFPLVTIFREKIDRNACWIGKVTETGKNKFSLFEIDTDGRWDKVYKYKYTDLTKVDFGGFYEEGLHLVSEFDREQEEKREEEGK